MTQRKEVRGIEKDRVNNHMKFGINRKEKHQALSINLERGNNSR
jgi:hypothetical protein